MSDLLNPFDIVIQLRVWQGINLMGVMARCLTYFFPFLLSILSVSSPSHVCHLAATDTLAALYTCSTLSSPWGRLGIVRHIKKSNSSLAF